MRELMMLNTDKIGEFTGVNMSCFSLSNHLIRLTNIPLELACDVQRVLYRNISKKKRTQTEQTQFIEQYTQHFENRWTWMELIGDVHLTEVLYTDVIAYSKHVAPAYDGSVTHGI